MKIKVISAMSESGLENKANNFIANSDIEVVEMQFAAHIFGYVVMITYKSNTNSTL